MTSLALLASALVACGPGADDEPVACRNQEQGVVEIGAGDMSSGFLTLADGGELWLRSTVGGPALTVSLRVVDFELGTPTQRSGVAVEVTRPRDGAASADDRELVAKALEEMNPESAGGIAEFLGILCMVRWSREDIDSLVNSPIRVDAQVFDGCGRVLGARKPARVARSW